VPQIENNKRGEDGSVNSNGGVCHQSSLLTWLSSYISLWPPDVAINAMLADIEAVWQISKARLIGYPLLGSASQSLGRKHPDELHVFVPVIELVHMVKEKNCVHGVMPPNSD
jgi:hypothetical protein